MCQYCEFKGSATNRDDRKRADLLDGTHESLELFLSHTIGHEDEYCLWVVDNRTSESIDSVQIHFCPVCGREL